MATLRWFGTLTRHIGFCLFQRHVVTAPDCRTPQVDRLELIRRHGRLHEVLPLADTNQLTGLRWRRDQVTVWPLRCGGRWHSSWTGSYYTPCSPVMPDTPRTAAAAFGARGRTSRRRLQTEPPA